MPAPKSLCRVRLEELLADGDWHNRETIIEQLAPLVAPGRAERRAQSNRANQRRRRTGTTEMTAPHNSRPADSQRVGARMIVRDVIGTALEHNAIEQRCLGVTFQIRLKP